MISTPPATARRRSHVSRSAPPAPVRRPGGWPGRSAPRVALLDVTPLRGNPDTNVVALVDLRLFRDSTDATDATDLRNCRLIRLPGGRHELAGPQLRRFDPDAGRTAYHTLAWWPADWGEAFAAQAIAQLSDREASCRAADGSLH